MVWTILENLVQKNLNIEKIMFKVVQMKFLGVLKFLSCSNEGMSKPYINGNIIDSYFR